MQMCMKWGTKQNGQQEHPRHMSLGSEVLQRGHDVVLTGEAPGLMGVLWKPQGVLLGIEA